MTTEVFKPQLLKPNEKGLEQVLDINESVIRFTNVVKATLFFTITKIETKERYFVAVVLESRHGGLNIEYNVTKDTSFVYYSLISNS